jgi:hypothetical protein
MANNCHTADVAWCLMYEQKLDMQIKLNSTKANLLRRKARKIEIEERLSSSKESDRLLAQADLMEFESNNGLLELAIEGAESELETITKIMEELEPQREFGHLPILEASQAAQRKEWLLEFQRRTENYLMSIGTIPEDQLNAMRSHPDFETQIVPYVQLTMSKINESKNKLEMLRGNNHLLLEAKDAS